MPDAVTLEFLAARVAGVTDEMHDLKLRMSGIEARLGGIEVRIGGLEKRFEISEERTSRILAILVRLAERQGVAGE